MADVPDIATMAPASGRVGAPASGTYGEKAQAEQLAADLPSSTGPGGADQGPQPLPPMGGGGMPQPPPPTGGLPAGLSAPTRRPNEPVSTMLTAPAPVAATSNEQLIQLFQMVATNPQSSQAFRTFAELQLEKLGVQ